MESEWNYRSRMELGSKEVAWPPYDANVEPHVWYMVGSGKRQG